jgi:hypothetical protein
MNATTANLDTNASALCEQRWGKGAWLQPKVNRSYWRRQAKRMMDNLGNKFREELLNDRLPCN